MKIKFKLNLYRFLIISTIFSVVFAPLEGVLGRYLPDQVAKDIAQVLPRVNEAQALNISDNMILFYNPASASNDADLPSGWTCISCSGQAYDNYFLVGSTSFGTGGAKTATAHTSTVTNSNASATRDGDNSGSAKSSSTHTHSSLSATFNTPSNYPLYGRLMMIKYTGVTPISSLPDNVIAVFDSAPPSGWTTLTNWDDRIIIASDSADGTGGGSDTHTHSITWSTLAASSGTRTEGSTTSNVTAASSHTHTAPANSNSDTQANVPQHASLIFATTDGTVTNFTNMIAMFDTTPNTSLWEILSGSGGVLENDFIEASTSYNALAGGSSTHTHGNVTSGVSGTQSASATGQNAAGDGTTAAGSGGGNHTHTLTASSISSVNHLPPYKGVIFAKSKAVQTTQTHFRWYNDDGGGASGAGELYYNPTGNGYGTVDFQINTGCSASSEWDCLDDESADTQASIPVNDNTTSSLQSVAGTDYYTLADDAIDSSATVTQLDISLWALDTGNPDANITLGYCVTCDGVNDVMGATQAVSVASYTEYTQQFSGLNLSTTDMNNLQLVVMADGVRAAISSIYVKVSYTYPAATAISDEDIPASGSEELITNSTYRLRFQVANNNTAATASLDKWRLEMTKRGASCTSLASGWNWRTVPLTASVASDAFDIELSSHFSDGASTSAGVMTAGAGTFVAGYLLENRATTGYQTIGPDKYTEIAFNLKPNSNADTTAEYCFRLSHLIDGFNNPASSSYSQIAYAGVQAAPVTTYTQNHYQWFYNNDALEPAGIIAAEDNRADITQGQTMKLRVNFTIGTNPLDAGEVSLRLKYSESLSGPWTDVGQYNSSDTIRFYNSSGLTDGATLTGSSKLTGTDVLGTYQKTNPSAVNPNSAAIGQDVEYDFSVNPKRATPGSTYYFRVYKSDDTPLDAYTNNPTFYIVPFVPSSAGGGGGSSNSGGQGNSGGGDPKNGGGQSGGGGATDPTGAGDSGEGTVLVGGDADGGGTASPVMFNWSI